MNKKKILFVYPSMIVGGSTTSLLSFINALDPDKYSIDLQLYKNEGPLLDMIPGHVNLLPEAQLLTGKLSRITKILKFCFKGYALKAIIKGIKSNSGFFSRSVLGDFKAKELSKGNVAKYDYAIGFLEGWSDRFLAWNVNSEKKYAWLHSTFANITNDPEAELSWMKRVDKIVFVADACRESFVEILPDMAEKCVTIENITDDTFIQRRSNRIDESDIEYLRFSSFDGLKVITVCRIDINTKGLDRAIITAKKMKDARLDFIWLIVGDGEQMEQLKQMIGEAGVDDVLIPVGRRMNPYPFIGAADVMCMLSRYEGKPMVVTESMILNTPVIITEYLSSHDQVNDGVEGFIVPNDDIIASEKAAHCISNKDVLLRMKDYLSLHKYGNKEYIHKIEKELFNS